VSQGIFNLLIVAETLPQPYAIVRYLPKPCARLNLYFRQLPKPCPSPRWNFPRYGNLVRALRLIFAKIIRSATQSRAANKNKPRRLSFFLSFFLSLLRRGLGRGFPFYFLTISFPVSISPLYFTRTT